VKQRVSFASAAHMCIITVVSHQDLEFWCYLRWKCRI